MKFAETPISSQLTIYLKDSIQQVFQGLKPGDVLEWHGEDGKVVVKKK